MAGQLVQYGPQQLLPSTLFLVSNSGTCPFTPSVAEWSKAPEFDAETGGESPVQAPVWAVTFSPYV